MTSQERLAAKQCGAMLIVAVFILVIAGSITSTSPPRAHSTRKRGGITQVMGAFKSQLVKQFIFESLLIAAIAFGVAFAIVIFLQPSFNQIVGSELSLKTLLSYLA